MSSRVVEWTRDLVRIPSVNPHGDPGVDHPGEQACAVHVAGILRGMGAAVELREVRPGRPNVIGRFPTDRPGKPRLILAPHLDTVSVAGMTIDPFSADLRDGRIWGRGASDTKGPMAAMLAALDGQADAIAALPHELWFVGLMGEEAGQEGARVFVAESVASGDLDPLRTCALIGEPTEFRAVYTTKGAFWVKAIAHGNAVHASAPDRGDNAIYRMADLLGVLRSRVLPGFATMNDPILGQPTGSAGVIRGGTKINIVPDRCELDIDFRTIPGQDTAAILAALREAAPGVELEAWESAPMHTDPSHPFVRHVASLGAGACGAPWFCDAAVFTWHGIAAVAAGPGSIAQAHTVDEWVSVDDLERGVGFYRRAVGLP